MFVVTLAAVCSAASVEAAAIAQRGTWSSAHDSATNMRSVSTAIATGAGAAVRAMDSAKCRHEHIIAPSSATPPGTAMLTLADKGRAMSAQSAVKGRPDVPPQSRLSRICSSLNLRSTAADPYALRRHVTVQVHVRVDRGSRDCASPDLTGARCGGRGDVVGGVLPSLAWRSGVRDVVDGALPSLA